MSTLTHASAAAGGSVLVPPIADVIQHGLRGAPLSSASLIVAGLGALYAGAAWFVAWKWPNAKPLPPLNGSAEPTRPDP